jgi:hypothetical protein
MIDPNETLEAMSVKWFPVVDDTIGGAAVSTVDKPISAHDYRKGDFVVAHFISFAYADYLAGLHNRRLAQRGGQDPTQYERPVRWNDLEEFARRYAEKLRPTYFPPQAGNVIDILASTLAANDLAYASPSALYALADVLRTLA